MLVETRSLTKRYGDFAALADCNMSVRAGEVFGLLGPNGAGKTTLLRLLMGFLRPTAGSAVIAGLDCYRQSVAVHRDISYLPGEVRLFRRMRGRDVLRFFSHIRPGGNLSRALALAERLELDLSPRVVLMSTGMRQKLGLCAVLSADAPLLILDEPTTNLDPTVRSDVIAMVREAKAAGRTVLFSSHVLSEVEQVCDRVAILSRGRMVHLQVMSELRRQHRVRARLTGPMPPVPARFDGLLTVRTNGAGEVTIDTADELSPLLAWLASLPLADVRIDSLGLTAVYERYHGGGAV